MIQGVQMHYKKRLRFSKSKPFNSRKDITHKINENIQQTSISVQILFKFAAIFSLFMLISSSKQISFYQQYSNNFYYIQHMEDQPKSDLSKTIETVKKYTSLMDQNKPYQFAQKIKMLSNRKLQSNKFQDAEIMLTTAIEQALKRQNVDINICHELIDQLMNLYQTNPKLWSLEKSKNFHKLMTIRNNQKRFEYYVKLLKLLKNAPMCKQILTDLIQYYEQNKQFTKAESHVIQLSVQQIMRFYQKWIKFVQYEESVAIRCRLALLKGIFSQSFDESNQILQGVNQQSPFYKFAQYLMMASKNKNREAYNKIGSCYSQFLQNDQVYQKIYNAYGTYFFSIKPSSKGLGSLMSVFN